MTQRRPAVPIATMRDQLLGAALAKVWARIGTDYVPPRRPSMAPSDNLQRSMNLIMPLRWRSVVVRAQLAQGLYSATDQILAGLNNVGTVHFARFDLIGRNLCMFSIYDGDMAGYLRDFIAAIGPAFDMLMGFVADPPPLPVGFHVDEFTEWIERHDAFQLPGDITDISPDLTTLPRRILVLFERHPDLQLGLYRNYPGFSASQIRDALEVGW